MMNSNQNALREYVDSHCHLGKKISSLKCVLCALIKINYIALKSKIFWFNKHFFQQKVSLLDNLQMFDLVLIQNCFTLSLQWQKFLQQLRECSQQKPNDGALFHHLPDYLKLMCDRYMVLQNVCLHVFENYYTATHLHQLTGQPEPFLGSQFWTLIEFQNTGWVDLWALKYKNKHTRDTDWTAVQEEKSQRQTKPFAGSRLMRKDDFRLVQLHCNAF